MQTKARITWNRFVYLRFSFYMPFLTVKHNDC